MHDLTNTIHYEGLLYTVWENQLSSIQCVMIMVAQLSMHVLCLIFSLSEHFVFSCIILVVDLSSIVDSVRPCTVHIGPSPPC